MKVKVLLHTLPFDDLLNYASEHFKIDQSEDELFRKLRRNDFTGGFSESGSYLRILMNWMWLACHAGLKLEQISPIAFPMLKRALRVYPKAAGDNFRIEHDLFLLTSSVMLGSKSLILEAADAITHAELPLRRPEDLGAFLGIVKGFILKDHVLMEEQRQLFLKARKTSVYRNPRSAMVSAFADGDWKALGKSGVQVVKREWEVAGKYGQVQSRTNDEILLDFRKGRSFDHFWPWNELIMTKLAHSSGSEWSGDEVWIPREIVCSWWRT